MEFILSFIGLFMLLLPLIFLFLEYRRLKKVYLDLKEQKPKQVQTIEAQQILHDLTTQGTSIIKITAISPQDIFWRSPR